ncbi:MAG: type II secretion system F family protein, partial [Rhodomicrobium sp.]
SKIRRELSKAGYFGENSVIWYQSIRLSLLGSFAIIALLITNIFQPQLLLGTKIIITACAAALGFLLPSRYIGRRQKQLVEECRNGFPDFVDLMVICAEAGLSPRAAIDRLSREIASTYPYLGANLYLTNLEIRAGNSIHEALFNLGRRTQVEEVSTLASLLQQTEQLGTSITDALRIYSDEMRERRLIRAEERAHSLPVKLVLPLGLFVFPVILIVILLPVVIRMKNAML